MTRTTTAFDDRVCSRRSAHAWHGSVVAIRSTVAGLPSAEIAPCATSGCVPPRLLLLRALSGSPNPHCIMHNPQLLIYRSLHPSRVCSLPRGKGLVTTRSVQRTILRVYHAPPTASINMCKPPTLPMLSINDSGLYRPQQAPLSSSPGAISLFSFESGSALCSSAAQNAISLVETIVGAGKVRVGRDSGAARARCAVALCRWHLAEAIAQLPICSPEAAGYG